MRAVICLPSWHAPARRRGAHRAPERSAHSRADRAGARPGSRTAAAAFRHAWSWSFWGSCAAAVLARVGGTSPSFESCSPPPSLPPSWPWSSLPASGGPESAPSSFGPESGEASGEASGGPASRWESSMRRSAMARLYAASRPMPSPRVVGQPRDEPQRRVVGRDGVLVLVAQEFEVAREVESARAELDGHGRVSGREPHDAERALDLGAALREIRFLLGGESAVALRGRFFEALAEALGDLEQPESEIERGVRALPARSTACRYFRFRTCRSRGIPGAATPRLRRRPRRGRRWHRRPRARCARRAGSRVRIR